jgi:hypothetical protein
MRRALFIAAVAIATTGFVGVAPAHATGETIWVGSRNTLVPTDCARTGTQTQSGVNAHWQRIPKNYSAGAMDTPAYDTQVTPEVGENLPGATSTIECANKILDFLKVLAIDEEVVPAPGQPALVMGNEAQLLRNALFSGWADHTRPYETFLNDLYLTGPALASLHPTTGAYSPTALGLASCRVTPTYFLIECHDDAYGRVILRDTTTGYPWINPFTGGFMYIELGGGLSRGGGTTYGSMFLVNTDQGETRTTFGDPSLERHEQTHAQQWAQAGWDFGPNYISESLGDPGDATWYGWQHGGTTYDPACFNIYEKAAGFSLVGYPCPPNWTVELPLAQRHPSWL